MIGNKIKDETYEIGRELYFVVTLVKVISIYECYKVVIVVKQLFYSLETGRQ